MIASGQLEISHLISHVVSVDEAPAIYRQMLSGGENWLGVVFDWSGKTPNF